jgi:hypothetical protein
MVLLEIHSKCSNLGRQAGLPQNGLDHLFVLLFGVVHF